MQQFEIGANVEILHSDGDNAAQWTPATVVNKVSVMPGFKAFGHNAGNVVKMDGSPKGKGYVTVTEPGMIRPA